nr:hypothetical protein [Tanacetum cinerariifolium]
MDLDFAANENLRELSGEEAWKAIENFAQGQKELDNPTNIIFEQEIANLKAQAKRLCGNKNVWVEIHRGITWDREIPSFDEPEPQPQPFSSFPSLEVDLGEDRDLKPPIKPPSPNSFRMKKVDHLTIHIPPSPHVASFHHKDTYCYYHPCIDDPKKHYGFKPGLLGLSGSLGVDFSKLEMIEDDLELELLSIEITNKIACRKLLIKNEEEIFTVPRDAIEIKT